VGTNDYHINMVGKTSSGCCWFS